jgi:hypothetical protein
MSFGWKGGGGGGGLFDMVKRRAKNRFWDEVQAEYKNNYSEEDVLSKMYCGYAKSTSKIVFTAV